MNILGRLFGRAAGGDSESVRRQATDPASITGLEDRFMWVGETLFETGRSPNGRWILGWSDATPDGTRAGARGGGRGAWVLFEGDRERARGRLERPNDGHVANDGRFVLADWLFTDQLAGVFYAFAPDGTPLVSERLGANAGSTAISPDGRFALVETLHSHDPDWSGRLTCYDLDDRTRRWSIEPPNGISEIEFLDAEARSAVLHLRNDRVRTVALADGSLGDSSEEPGTDNMWAAFDELEDAVRTGLDGADDAEISAWLASADGLEPRFADYTSSRARVHRLRGELLEKAGRPAEAAAAYLAGLELDPGLGVKRRLKALGIDVAPSPKPTSTPRQVNVDDRPNASTACPSCGTELNPLPKAKARCRACGATIWVRSGPDGLRHLLRDDQLAAHEAQWQEAYEARERERLLIPERQQEADRAAGLIAGLYDLDVVGESHYQDALRRFAGAPGGWTTTSVIVELVREPANPYDPNAVAVRLDGSIVGRLPREEAALVSPMLKALERGSPCRARATIQGGSPPAFVFGITIDGIPDPYEFAGL